MNWHRIHLSHGLHNVRAVPNVTMNTALLYLLNDSRGANRYPYIDHGLNLEVEITRMFVTAQQFQQTHPSFWLYKDPLIAEPRIPIVFSRTWVRPATEGWHWLSVFQMFDIDDHDSVKRLYERREWYPYKELR